MPLAMKAALLLPALALGACAAPGGPAPTGPEDRALTQAQRAQIRNIRNSDDTTLSQNRQIEAVLSR